MNVFEDFVRTITPSDPEEDIMICEHCGGEVDIRDEGSCDTLKLRNKVRTYFFCKEENCKTKYKEALSV